MRILSAAIALTIIVTGCSEGALSSAEREWCTFDDSSEESALRFDLIFEAGIILELPMDALNAQAAASLQDYIAEGLTVDEAARRVSDELLETETFVVACKQAYADEFGD